MSDIGAEQNHLWPDELVLARPRRRRSAAVATVVLARTSEPPCFSVIAMPAIAEPFSRGRDQARVVGAWR